MARLTSLCRQADDDHDVVKSLKEKGRDLLKTKVRLDVVHDLAAFLTLLLLLLLLLLLVLLLYWRIPRVPLMKCCPVDDTSPENTIVGLPPS